MTKLNLRDEQNQQLIKLISDEDIDTIGEEMEFRLFQLAKGLNQKKITKSSVEALPTNQTPTTKTVVKINFKSDYFPTFTFEVDTAKSVEDLILLLESKRIFG